MSLPMLSKSSVAASLGRGTEGELVAVLCHVLASGIGQRELGLAALAARSDEFLVDELLQRRVHGAGARPPGAVGLLADRLHDAVAVETVGLGEQRQDGEPHVALGAAGGPRPKNSARGSNPGGKAAGPESVAESGRRHVAGLVV